MFRTIIGFQHDPELVIMNGIPTYMTSGNTYRDKVLNHVTLDYICFIDTVAEQTHIAVSTPTTTIQTDTPVYQRTLEDKHDHTLPMKRRSAKRNIRAGGSRHYKKINTRMRVNGMDAKLSMEYEDIQDQDQETQCIHSTRYYERAQEFEDMLQNYYVDMEKEYEDYLDNIGRYRDSDYYCCY